MLFINKLFNSIAFLLYFINLQLVIPGRTWILLYLVRTVYKRLWAFLALYSVASHPFWRYFMISMKSEPGMGLFLINISKLSPTFMKLLFLSMNFINLLTFVFFLGTSSKYFSTFSILLFFIGDGLLSPTFLDFSSCLIFPNEYFKVISHLYEILVFVHELHQSADFRLFLEHIIKIFLCILYLALFRRRWLALSPFLDFGGCLIFSPWPGVSFIMYLVFLLYTGLFHLFPLSFFLCGGFSLSGHSPLFCSHLWFHVPSGGGQFFSGCFL